MRFLVAFMVLLLCLEAASQEARRRNPGRIVSQYSNLRYEIIDIDTMVIHCVYGTYNTPGFKRWDSTTIWANIIITNLPKKVDTASLRQNVMVIMKCHGIKKGSVFRDEYSIMLAQFSSDYAWRKLKERDGYFGIFDAE